MRNRTSTGGTDPMEKWQKQITQTVLELAKRVKAIESQVNLLTYQHEKEIR